MDKMAIVLDTNVAHSPNKICSFNEFHIYEHDNAISFIERHDLTEYVEVFLPEIVLEEITEHRRRSLDSAISKMKELVKQFESTNLIEVDFREERIDTNAYVLELKKRKIKEISQILIPHDHTFLFDSILEKALKKSPPFKEGKSDHGFKDAIMISSIVEHFISRKAYSEIVLFTDDEGAACLDTKSLKEKHNLDIKIIKGKNVQEYIADRFKLKVEIKDYLKQKSLNDLIEKFMWLTVSKDESFVNSGYELVSANVDKHSINEINEKECDIIFSANIKYLDLKKNIKRKDMEFLLNFYKDEKGLWQINSPE